MWRLVYAKLAADAMRKLDKEMARRIRTYMDDVLGSGDPRSRGRGLSGPLAGYWRYRIGDYRVVAAIEDGQLTVIALDIDHRSVVYKEQR